VGTSLLRHSSNLSEFSIIIAYELFESYQRSSAHYQTVIIIRNKIKGPASALLVSYNSVLNFKAILARLDCSYADKTHFRLLRQGLESVRQATKP